MAYRELKKIYFLDYKISTISFFHYRFDKNRNGRIKTRKG